MINILWDLDGTVVDSMPIVAACMNRTVEHFGLPPRPLEEMNPFIGPSLSYSMGVLLDTDDKELIASAVEHYRAAYKQMMHESPVFDGIEQALAHFKSVGATHYLATAKFQGFAEHIIVASGLKPYFTGIYGSMLDGRLANKDELLAELIKAEGIEPGNSVMIGDTHYDIEAGRHHNMTTIGVLWGYSTEQKLKESGAHYCVNKPDELNEIIKSAMTCAC
ncbi:HAD hydrolase-like protein [Reinekea marinisedimentorum]|uniref:Phosphoglycolate phosphatase n=1 Tax=Reinekea marinisedimentorum TaxID=230495 RepID=A0A4R3HTN0_9GAMM|nr:HAD hydrolase-like protein [Reinekea marinisedimentorum]TCS36432.1 phosphoglycolate phosphatase [Reinekea marinisedimentorum]